MKNLKCNFCKYYKSYRDAYFGDELEPDYQGFCRGNPGNDGWTLGEFDACVYYVEKPGALKKRIKTNSQ